MQCLFLCVIAGLAGCYAAIAAARHGKSVVLVEKGATERSGSAGSGFDHWESACTNPCSSVTAKEIAEAYVNEQDGYSNGIGHYIECREGYDRLLDMESFGGKIRDTERGFNPKKHMLQSYGTGWQSAAFLDQERQLFGAPGGIITDWDLKTNIDGIYAAGDQLYASDCCGTKCKDLLTEGLDLLAQYMRMERL